MANTKVHFNMEDCLVPALVEDLNALAGVTVDNCIDCDAGLRMGIEFTTELSDSEKAAVQAAYETFLTKLEWL